MRLTSIVINFLKRKLNKLKKIFLKIYRYIEAEKQFLLINLRSKQAMRINKDLEKVSRLEETIEGKFWFFYRKFLISIFRLGNGRQSNP